MGEQQIVHRGVQNTIGCPPLRHYAKGKKEILIITDDNTRSTPLKKILPYVIDELKVAGIKDEAIKILIASGTHRPMTARELREKFGSAILSRFKIYSHNWRNKDELKRIDSTIYGKKICVNRLAEKSDFIIGIGSILPHATTGFSGGGKIILPGICGEETSEDLHWKALEFKMKDILGVYNNPMRKTIDSVANKVGLKFIVNVVMDASNRIVEVVAGDPVKAHKHGADISKRIFGLRISEPADIVIADAKPMDIDLRQAIKAVCASDLVVKEGGVIVLNARCKEGISPQFPEFERYGFKDPERLKKQVETDKVKGKLMAYTLITIGRIMKNKKVILVSKGITKETAQQLGFLWARSLKDALKRARELCGKEPRTIFLKRACEILPLMN